MLEKRRDVSDLCYVYKLLHLKHNGLSYNSLNMVVSTSTYRKYDLKETYCSNKKFRNEFSKHVIAKWNCLPNELKSLTSYAKFKKKVIQFYILSL